MTASCRASKRIPIWTSSPLSMLSDSARWAMSMRSCLSTVRAGLDTKSCVAALIDMEKLAAANSEETAKCKSVYQHEVVAAMSGACVRVPSACALDRTLSLVLMRSVLHRRLEGSKQHWRKRRKRSSGCPRLTTMPKWRARR